MITNLANLIKDNIFAASKLTIFFAASKFINICKIIRLNKVM